MRPRVSLSMIVKDGADTLPRCLESVAGLVDEIVVVDTGSCDETMAVAANLGARVEPIPWTDSFAESRNASLRLSRGEWVFWLDADEWLDEAACERFRALTDQLEGRNEVYLMRQVSAALSVAQARLFRNGDDISWSYRVHEQILPACQRRGDQITDPHITIHHSGYDSPDRLRAKSARNLRLLELEHAEEPDDPYISLQLGRLLLQDRFAEAETHLRRALARFEPGDPLARQLYPLLAGGYRVNGRLDDAMRAVNEGLARAPNDTALLSEAGVLAFAKGGCALAESFFQRLLRSPPDPDEFLGTVDLSLRGWRARHNLAVVYQKQGRSAEAETQWRAAVTENFAAAPAWRGLTELYLAESRWADFDAAVAMLETHAHRSAEVSDDDAPIFRACAHLSRREFGPGRALLTEIAARSPSTVWPRVLLARSHRFEGTNPAATTSAWRDVLAVDPNNAEAMASLKAPPTS